METSLRKMGNSIGMIVPKAALAEIGATLGARMTLRVDNGVLIAEPMATPVRAGWAEGAAIVGTDDDAAGWRTFGNDGDADLTW